MQTTVKVNGQVISREAIQFELERLVRFYAEHGMSQDEIREQLPDLVKKATDQAIGAKLLMDEAARLDLQVTDEDLDGEVAKIVDQVGGEEAFRRALQQQNTTEDAFREQLRRGRRVDKLIEKAVADVADPTEAEIEAGNLQGAKEKRRQILQASAGAEPRAVNDLAVIAILENNLAEAERLFNSLEQHLPGDGSIRDNIRFFRQHQSERSA